MTAADWTGAAPGQGVQAPGILGADDAVPGGRYRLDRLIGRGGMADVYAGLDLLAGLPVAVKMLRAGTAGDPRRFAVEAQLLGGLRHPNLVRLIDAGTEEDRPFLVMELVEGPTLAELPRPLGELETARAGQAIASALAEVHRCGVVHRDVKPANILVGSDGRFRLTDFGIARLTDAAGLTLDGWTLGTPAYLAPEQLEGHGTSYPADVYALGLVLLECLTGDKAFPGSATEAAVARLHRDPYVPSDVPRPWRALLTDMTARHPAARPGAARVAASLGNAVEVLGSSGGPGANRAVAPNGATGSPTSPDGTTRPLDTAGAASRVIGPRPVGGAGPTVIGSRPVGGAGPTVMAPAADATLLGPPTDATVVGPSTDPTLFGPSSDATLFGPSRDATVVGSATDARIVGRSAGRAPSAPPVPPTEAFAAVAAGRRMTPLRPGATPAPRNASQWPDDPFRVVPAPPRRHAHHGPSRWYEPAAPATAPGPWHTVAVATSVLLLVAAVVVLSFLLAGPAHAATPPGRGSAPVVARGSRRVGGEAGTGQLVAARLVGAGSPPASQAHKSSAPASRPST